jgi:radical SAM protein with 4Fe4S-binding SPASM domain
MTTSEVVKTLQKEGLRPPKKLTIAITGACNLKCSHCWVDAGITSSAAHVPLPKVVRVIEEFAAFGGEGIRFTGGEPLCHPGWREALQSARRLGLREVALQTNGMLFGEEQVVALRDLDFSGLSLQISLDGATASSHDLVRGKGAFRGLLKGLGQLARGGLAPRVSLFFTEMRHNLEEVPAVLELAEELGNGSVVGGSLVLCGRAEEESALAPAEVEQYLRLLERYDADPRFRELYKKIGTMAALEWHVKGALHAECCTFVENPYLTAQGTLYPCVLFHADDFAVAGVFDKGLANAFLEGTPLWTHLLQINRSRASQIPECRDCPGSLTCAGGCPGRTWGSCGDLMAAEDRCALRRAIHDRQQISSSAGRKSLIFRT